LETETVVYLTYAEALLLHILLMRQEGETRYGVFERPLVEFALARPRQAAAYANADLIAQAATLCYGLIKNHPWMGGNKRTATVLVEYFLYRNGIELLASEKDGIKMALAVEADEWKVEEIEMWLRENMSKLD
jgi:death-on-curing protein